MAVPRQAIPIEKIGEVLSYLNDFDARLFKAMLLTGMRCCEARLLGVSVITNPDGSYRPGFATLAETKGGYQRNIAMTQELVSLFDECKAAYGGVWKKYDYTVMQTGHGMTTKRVSVDVAVFRPETWARKKNHFACRVKMTRGINATENRKYQRIPFGYTYESVQRAFTEAFNASGLYGPHTTHGIRKTFAEMVLEATDEQGRPVNDIFTLKELLGHSSLSSTLHYVKGISVAKAVRSLDAAYKSSGLKDVLKPPTFALPEGPPPTIKSGTVTEATSESPSSTPG